MSYINGNTKPNKTCISALYESYLEWLEIPQWIGQGGQVSGDCAECDKVKVWSRPVRRSVTRNLYRAVTTLQKRRDVAYCPHERTLIAEEHECPIQLGSPLWYKGKRFEVRSSDYDLCFNLKSACNDYIGCNDLDYMGQIVIDQIPDEWDGDLSHVEFCYPKSAREDLLILPQPDLSYDCCDSERTEDNKCPEDCGCITKCNLLYWNDVEELPEDAVLEIGEEELERYCQYLEIEYDCGEEVIEFERDDRVFMWSSCNEVTIGTVLWITDEDVYYIGFEKIEFNEYSDINRISVPHLVATWDMFELVHPQVNSTDVYHSHCNNFKQKVMPNFIDSVNVKFFAVDETKFIEVVNKCSCDTCKVCHSKNCYFKQTVEEEREPPCEEPFETCAYEFDSNTCELCIQCDNCKNCECHEDHYFKITYGVKPEIEEDVLLAILLRALLWSHNIKCNCTGYDDRIEYWMSLEPGIEIEALSTAKHYPYGRSRAGVELLRLLKEDEKQLEKRGKLKVRKGIFSGRFNEYKKRGLKSINPRARNNNGDYIG